MGSMPSAEADGSRPACSPTVVRDVHEIIADRLLLLVQPVPLVAEDERSVAMKGVGLHWFGRRQNLNATNAAAALIVQVPGRAAACTHAGLTHVMKGTAAHLGDI